MTDGSVLRVGIIGTGRIASSIIDEPERAASMTLLPYSHAGAYAEVAATRVVSAADVNGDRLREFGARWGVAPLYTDYREMLRREQLDIVSICTPSRSHCEVALDVAASKVRAIYLEKSVAQCLADADRMIAAFAAGGQVVAVNHVRTYNPFYRRVRWLIESGAIGKLHSIMVHWREGMLFGGSHLFDTLRFLIGAEAAWVFGRLDEGDGVFDPGGSGLIGFQNGVEVYVNNRLGNAVPWEFDIAGSAGRIRIGNALYPELYTVDPASPSAEMVRRVFPGSMRPESAMVTAVKEIVRALETGQAVSSTMADGRADLELAVAFHLSDRTRAVVELPVTDLDYTILDPWGRT